MNNPSLKAGASDDILKNRTLVHHYQILLINQVKGIKTSDDFIRDDYGLEKLDSICMQLINIGEALKQIDILTEQKLLQNYIEIDWKRAKGMRDIITHHYFDIDAETVFMVCTDHIPRMRNVIEKILHDL